MVVFSMVPRTRFDGARESCVSMLQRCAYGKQRGARMLSGRTRSLVARTDIAIRPPIRYGLRRRRRQRSEIAPLRA